MRKSVRRKDPGYDSEAHKYEVFLNDEKLDNCFTADEEKGEVFVFLRDKDGNRMFNANGGLMEARLTGKVKLVKKY